MTLQNKCPSCSPLVRDYLMRFVRLKRKYCENSTLIKSSQVARRQFLRELQELYLRNPRLRFDFLGDEKDNFLKEIRNFHSQAICGPNSPPPGEWDYLRFPTAITPDRAQISSDSILNFSAGFLRKAKNVAPRL